MKRYGVRTRPNRFVFHAAAPIPLTLLHSKRQLKQNWCIQESVKHLLFTRPKQIEQFGGGDWLSWARCCSSPLLPDSVSAPRLSFDGGARRCCCFFRNSRILTLGWLIWDVWPSCAAGHSTDNASAIIWCRDFFPVNLAYSFASLVKKMSFMRSWWRTRKMYSSIYRGQLTNHEPQSAIGKPRTNSTKIHKSLLFFMRSACSWNLWCNIVVSSRQCNEQQVCIHCQAQCSRFMFVTIWCAMCVWLSVCAVFTILSIRKIHKIYCSTRSQQKWVHSMRWYENTRLKNSIKYKHFYTLQCVNAILFSRAQCDGVLRKIDSSEEWWLYVNWFISLLCFFSLVLFSLQCVVFMQYFPLAVTLVALALFAVTASQMWHLSPLRMYFL